MPWKEVSSMSLRREFVELASGEVRNVRELAARFGISRKTAYKWLERFHEGDPECYRGHPRKPIQTPSRTARKRGNALGHARRRNARRRRLGFDRLANRAGRRLL